MAVTTHPRAETAPPPGVILDRAAARLSARLEASLPTAGELARQEALDLLDALVAVLHGVLNGADIDENVRNLPRPGLQTRLIDALIAEVLAPPADVEHATATLSLIQSLHLVRGTLRSDGPEELRARLTKPDAFELLIEVAHDLRSPLTSILFLSEALRVGHSGEVNDLQRSQLGLIYSAALGLASVASDIVDLAREGKGLIEGEPEPYSLAEVFCGVEDLLRPMAEEKRIELRVEVPEHERSVGHPSALGRVLLNLTANALKFTDHGYVEMGVKRVSRGRLEFFVRDTGRGIAEAQQEVLFQPFKRRADGQGHFFSGSGVGLTIARRLVRSMGSDLHLETAPDWGTRFSFTLETPPIQ